MAHTPSEGKRSTPTVRAWSYLHFSILSKPLIRTRRTRKNIRICWFTLTRTTANQWVFYWTLFSFSNWLFTWASSVLANTRHHLCSHSPWRHVSSTSVINRACGRAVLHAPTQLQRKQSALCWKGTWRVAETLIYHKYLLTKLAEL